MSRRIVTSRHVIKVPKPPRRIAAVERIRRIEQTMSTFVVSLAKLASRVASGSLNGGKPDLFAGITGVASGSVDLRAEDGMHELVIHVLCAIRKKD